jgi:galactose mutarotase-like enzyme
MKHTLVNKYQTLDDKNYYRISMFNKNGVQVDILNYGATLEHFFVPGRTSEKDNIILSLERPEYYEKNGIISVVLLVELLAELHMVTGKMKITQYNLN